MVGSSGSYRTTEYRWFDAVILGGADSSRRRPGADCPSSVKFTLEGYAILELVCINGMEQDQEKEESWFKPAPLW